jgi:hypothetical protein
MNGHFAYFASKADYKTWVTANLGLTLFASVAAWETMFDDLTTKMGILRSGNATLFVYLDNADDDQLVTVTAANQYPPVINTLNPCGNGCANTCDTSLNNAELSNSYMQTNYGGNPISDAIIDSMYWSDVEDNLLCEMHFV